MQNHTMTASNKFFSKDIFDVIDHKKIAPMALRALFD